MQKVVVSLLVLIFIGSVSAFSYTIDGYIDDWGVTGWDLIPKAGVSYTIENNWNRPNSDPFNEMWDLEAMYFDDDGDYINFGVVTSSTYHGGWASEDMGIDLNGDGEYEYGLDVSPSHEGYQIHDVYSVSSWVKKRGIPYRIGTGNKIGTFELYNRYWGAIEPGVGWKHTYFLEGRVSKSLFAGLACGTPIELILARVTCLKDWITVAGFCDGDCPPEVIPEPTTLLLLGSGLLGFSGLKLRKRKK
jgi:hypothetical protein